MLAAARVKRWWRRANWQHIQSQIAIWPTRSPVQPGQTRRGRNMTLRACHRRTCAGVRLDCRMPEQDGCAAEGGSETSDQDQSRRGDIHPPALDQRRRLESRVDRLTAVARSVLVRTRAFRRRSFPRRGLRQPAATVSGHASADAFFWRDLDILPGRGRSCWRVSPS